MLSSTSFYVLNLYKYDENVLEKCVVEGSGWVGDSFDQRANYQQGAAHMRDAELKINNIKLKRAG